MTMVQTQPATDAKEKLDQAVEDGIRLGTALIRGIGDLDEGGDEWRLAMYSFLDSQDPPLGLHFVQWLIEHLAVYGTICVPSPRYIHDVDERGVVHSSPRRRAR